MRYCTLCERYVDPTKSSFSWPVFILLCLTVFGGLIYAIYHLLLKSKNRCPICNTKKLSRHSPEDAEENRIRREERNKKIAETASSAASSIKTGVSNIASNLQGEETSGNDKKSE